MARTFDIQSGKLRQPRLGRTATAADLDTDGDTHYVIIAVTSTGAARAIELSTADCTAALTYIIKDEGGGAAANNITISTEGAELIDGAATLVISSNYGVARVYSNGSNWFTW